MNCQGPDLYEFLGTDPALVRFVSRVLPGVLLHVVLPSEGLAAPAAGELLLLLILRGGLLTVLGGYKVINVVHLVPLQSIRHRK